MEITKVEPFQLEWEKGKGRAALVRIIAEAASDLSRAMSGDARLS